MLVHRAWSSVAESVLARRPEIPGVVSVQYLLWCCPLVSSVPRFKGQLCHVILLLRLDRGAEAREVLQLVPEVTSSCVCA